MALIRLLHMMHIDEVKIRFGRNRREYKLPEFPLFCVEGYCFEASEYTSFSGGIATTIRVRGSVISSI